MDKTKYYKPCTWNTGGEKWVLWNNEYVTLAWITYTMPIRLDDLKALGVQPYIICEEEMITTVDGGKWEV